MDKAPFSEGHTLVCPKKHGETIWDMTEPEIGGLFALAARLSRAVMHATNSDGFRFVQNNGEAANQVVAHVHVHVIPVKLSNKGCGWIAKHSRWKNWKLPPKKFEKHSINFRVSRPIRRSQ